MSGAAEPRPAASLTSGLLARRGGAQPAMRRQPLGGFVSVTPGLDDLGWNDMGENLPTANLAPVVAQSVENTSSPIAQQIDAIARRIVEGRSDTVKPPVSVKQRKTTPKATARKAAFTLRLEPERHLRLRLLTAMTNTSAQRLLVAALDQLIAEHDQLERLARDATEQASMRPGK